MEDPSLSSAYSRLYEEAEASENNTSKNPTEEVCPLYHTLKRIDIRYGDETLISEGGMKEVFKVYDAPTERYVALARPKAEIPVERYDGFLREAHITARLEHPNIIKLFDMGIDQEERPFFTMEFKRGRSLRAILKDLKANKNLDEYPSELRFSIFLRVCEAMGYAHSKHVLHLDLKPENIQVGTFGEVQICDWGLGEIERGNSEEHMTAALLDPDLYGDQLPPPAHGTPGYMSPEQLNPRAVKSAQADIFALGCLLYELTTLRDTECREDSPPDSPAIAAIVKKACAEKPKHRYKNVETMRKDVLRHVLGFSPEVEQAGFIRECRLFYRRNRQPCLITMGFTALLIGAGSWFNAELSHSYRSTAEALDNTTLALSEAEDAKTHATIQRSIAEAARDRAELLLQKYTEEKEISSALLKSQSQNTVSGSLLLLDFLIMDESITMSTIDNALEQIDFALANNPPASDRLWTLKAYALFLTQQFDEALKYYSIREGTQGDLKALIAEYAPLIDENSQLPVDDFIRLIKALHNGPNDRAPLTEKMVIYDCLRRTSLEEKAKIIHAVLECSNDYNGLWENQIFDYSEATGHLKLGGTDLAILTRPKVPKEGSPYRSHSMLRFLDLRSLDISNTQVRALKQLDGLDLHYLDIRNTEIQSLTRLHQMPSLRELVVAPEQFTEQQLSKVPNFVKVITKPLNLVAQ